MKPKPGGVLNIRFRAAGENPLISVLHEKLTGQLEGDPICVGDLRFGVPSSYAFISLLIVEGADDKNDALEKLLLWLKLNRAFLKTLEADKWVEVSTYLLPDQAYDHIFFSLELMQEAMISGCRLGNTCFAIMAPLDTLHRRVLANLNGA